MSFKEKYKQGKNFAKQAHDNILTPNKNNYYINQLLIYLQFHFPLEPQILHVQIFHIPVLRNIP